ERSVKLTNVGQRFDENLLPLHLPLVPTENRNIFLRAHPQAADRSSRTLRERLALKAICFEDYEARGELSDASGGSYGVQGGVYSDGCARHAIGKR
ncbi:MAG: hypothetical protein ABSB21_01195, partial [Halobacteriota archaeon]